MPEEEFYVKEILKAKLVNVGGRDRPKKAWKFLVKWYDYPDLDWQPEENFTGDKWAIQTFWARAELEGRDPKKHRQFKLDEVISLADEDVPRLKPGPGRSSVGLINGTRVFALWPEMKHHQSAVVQRRVGDSDTYTVKFDEDDFETDVALDSMRACDDLQQGDTVVLKSDSARISAIKEDGTLRIKRRLNTNDIRIPAWSIDEEWGDRKLAHEDIECADGY